MRQHGGEKKENKSEDQNNVWWVMFAWEWDPDQDKPWIIFTFLSISLANVGSLEAIAEANSDYIITPRISSTKSPTISVYCFQYSSKHKLYRANDCSI